MIRVAEERDVVPILDIYAPYVRETTITFEYEVPTPEAFLARFEGITRDFPWLVWEEAGAVLGYAYASRPFERAAYAGARNPPSICVPTPGAAALAGSSMPRWRHCCRRWAMR